MSSSDPLDLFLPPVRAWFCAALGEPTAPQRLGWPSIAADQHTLLLAPTGSGKTLAAFLACLDRLWREPPASLGVRVLYISPLKALNNDIHRNLQLPLEGVAETASRMGHDLPEIRAAVRTGDTPTAERQRLIRRPPHVLITTPESLHLLLTSRARETLRHVSHVIVDEIHALCPNKRGVFLALLLERLEAIQRDGSFVRIGLSATQRPLDEVARYLGGFAATADGGFTPRPVNIVDAGIRKDLDLRVVNPVEQFGPLPEKSVWPSIYRLLADQIRQHRSTIVFANNRGTVERITSFLNEEENLARAHHGSVSLEARQQTEAALKEGRLPAVISTASLELGIDMGAVDLVCQIASPGNVARGLQRVGRAGHLVGQRSKGMLVPRTPGDLLEQAVLAREMAAGRVEAIRVPTNCLDVLAQQIVAIAAMDDWPVTDLFALVRRAYPYRDLSPQAFETTLEVITGRYRFTAEPLDEATNEMPRSPGPGTLGALQPRVSWDRVHNRLLALPGSRSLALTNGGTIPDTGQYAAYTVNNLRIGELDEEFVYERRVNDVFLLGTSAWRLERIEADRVIVSPAEGVPALVPFWKGEGGGRSYDLGCALGAFLRELAGRLDAVDCTDWLQREYFLDANAARSLRYHVVRQVVAAGRVPTDRTLLVEASRDQLGDWQVLLLSPFGQRLHLTLRLALEAVLQRRLGYRPQCLHHDDGILIRLTDTDEPITDLFTGLTPENVEDLVLDELADSALFAMRFRQNAARSLLLPRGKVGQRAPLWLQRLRGRDLLQVARRHPDFPIVVETFRECLHDHLDVDRLKDLLSEIGAGRMEVIERRAEVPSPFASGILFAFTAAFLYEKDVTESENAGTTPLDRQLLEQLVNPQRQGHLLDPRAVQNVDRRLRGLGQPPRSATEMAEWLRRLGDLSEAELEGPMRAFLQELEDDGRAVRLELPRVAASTRWVAEEDRVLYEQAFGLTEAEAETAQSSGVAILTRFLATHALVGLDDILRRYPFEPEWARRHLEEWARSGRVIEVRRSDTEPMQWSAPENLQQVQRGSLAILRREVVACPPQQFADFVLRWQGVHPESRRGESAGLAAVLARLEGALLPATLWEQTVLPVRVPGYQPRWLDDWSSGGSGVWVGRGDDLAFLARDTVLSLTPPPEPEGVALDEQAARLLDALRSRGASFVTDLTTDTGLSPGAIRQSLGLLARCGLVTNDRFAVIRRGECGVSEQGRESPPMRLSSSLIAPLRRSALRTPHSALPEGRWSAIGWGRPEPEVLAVRQAALLLNRYGIVSREVALLDPWMPSWRILYEIFSRMELAGDVRRGYFAEGLSGAQFAHPEAAALLQNLTLPSTATAPCVLLHSQDPANLYGSGAPFDVDLLDGGTRPFLRRGGNWLVQRAGKPVLLIEQLGKRVTALPSASREDLAAATACLPGLCGTSATVKHKVTIDEWNGQPVTTTPGKELLEAVGFVRDYQGMTLYAAWR